MNNEILQVIRRYISKAFTGTDNIFDGLIALAQSNWDASPTTIQELRQSKNTKIKGDLFEHFAYLYFTHCYLPKPKNVWLLYDIPKEVREKISLGKNDVGIDLLLEFENGYSAVQVKFRKPNPYKPSAGIGWKQLSTFYALVNRTGPYLRHIVFTNGNYVRHIGKKEPKDQSICLRRLQKIDINQWREMADIKSYSLSGKIREDIKEEKPLKGCRRKLDPKNKEILTLEEIREKRLARLE
jgi:hypothetical protein